MASFRGFRCRSSRKPLAAGGERVRVASEALDQMVNNAGEVSIYRARIEQQNNGLPSASVNWGRPSTVCAASFATSELGPRRRSCRATNAIPNRAPISTAGTRPLLDHQQLSRALSGDGRDLSKPRPVTQ